LLCRRLRGAEFLDVARPHLRVAETLAAVEVRELRFAYVGGVGFATTIGLPLATRCVTDRRLNGGIVMMFEEIRTGGCCSYLVACGETCCGVLVDPELSQIDRPTT
jgi:hypothetical protein